MDTSIICTLHRPWDQLDIYLVSLGCKVMLVKGDGFCFLNAIDLVLYCGYVEVITLENMVNNILEHLVANADYYKLFHTGDLLWDVEGWFQFGNYSDSIINVIITATTKALHVNLSIYQKRPDRSIQVIEQTADVKANKFTWILCRTSRIQLTSSLMPFCSLTNLVRYLIKTNMT